MDNTQNIYWTNEQDLAITSYLSASTDTERELIYNTKLHQPLSKLVECIFNRHSFDYIINRVGSDTAQKQCLSHLSTVLPKFKPEKGDAFGYFSVCSKFWFMQLNKRLYNEQQKSVVIDKDNTDEEYHATPKELSYTDYKDFDEKEFVSLLCDYLEKNEDLICRSSKYANVTTNKKRYHKILKSIIYLLRSEDVVFSECSITGLRNVTQRLKELSGEKVCTNTNFVSRFLMPHYSKIRKDYINKGRVVENAATESMLKVIGL